jgi:hypothetical protein
VSESPSTTTSADTSQERACCGELPGAWVPKPGEPRVPGCILCPNAPNYWNRAGDSQAGKPIGS